MSKKEFVIWGVKKGKKWDNGLNSEPLYTKAKTMKEAKRVQGILEKKYGVTKTDIQVIDLSQPLDLRQAFTRGIRR